MRGVFSRFELAGNSGSSKGEQGGPGHEALPDLPMLRPLANWPVSDIGCGKRPWCAGSSSVLVGRDDRCDVTSV